MHNPALLDTDLIRTFVTIADTGSFSRAAELVHRTPSAVSMQVKRLEELVERPLFLREARQVTLTSDGEKLLGFARQMLKLSYDALAEFSAPRLRGSVRLGAPDDFGSRFLPNILARFASTHPEIDVDVVLGPSVKLLERLDAGTIDVTLATSKPMPHAGQLRGQVLQEPMIWVGKRCGAAYQQERLPLALADQGCSWRSMALKALDEAGRSYRIAYSSEHGIGQLAAVLADLAIAPLPASLLDQRFERLGAAQGLPVLGQSEIYLACAGDCDAVGEALIEHVVACFHEDALQFGQS